jgi:hypothetical protein
MDNITLWDVTQAAEDAWGEIEPADRDKAVEILERHLLAAYEAGSRENTVNMAELAKRLPLPSRS